MIDDDGVDDDDDNDGDDNDGDDDENDDDDSGLAYWGRCGHHGFIEKSINSQPRAGAV